MTLTFADEQNNYRKISKAKRLKVYFKPSDNPVTVVVVARFQIRISQINIEDEPKKLFRNCRRRAIV